MKSMRRLPVCIFLIFVLGACGSAAATQGPSPTGLPSTLPLATDISNAETSLPELLSPEEQLARIDAILNQTLSANLAYNAPAEMQLHETVTIELLLNPSLSEEALKEELSEPGLVQSASVEITPQMKAELISRDGAAFSIRPVHDAPVQVISGTEATKWSWYVTAQKEGTQTLTIVLYRLVKYDNEEFWREVDAYKADIDVQVTLLDRFNALDWRGLALIAIALGAFPAFWLWYRQRRNAPALRPGVRGLHDSSGIGRSGKKQAGNIFVSYRRSDSADITGRIYDRLVDGFGRDAIFKDVDSIPLGMDFKQYLDTMVRECNVVLAIIGDRWIDERDAEGKRRLDDPDDFVRIEIESALESGIPVIPLLVRGAQMPVEENLPSALRNLAYRNGIPIRPDPDFHRDMDRLVAALNQYV